MFSCYLEVNKCVFLLQNVDGLCSKRRDKLYSAQSAIYITLFVYIYLSYCTTKIVHVESSLSSSYHALFHCW